MTTITRITFCLICLCTIFGCGSDIDVIKNNQFVITLDEGSKAYQQYIVVGDDMRIVELGTLAASGQLTITYPSDTVDLYLVNTDEQENTFDAYLALTPGSTTINNGAQLRQSKRFFSSQQEIDGINPFISYPCNAIYQRGQKDQLPTFSLPVPESFTTEPDSRLVIDPGSICNVALASDDSLLLEYAHRGMMDNPDVPFAFDNNRIHYAFVNADETPFEAGSIIFNAEANSVQVEPLAQLPTPYRININGDGYIPFTTPTFDFHVRTVPTTEEENVTQDYSLEAWPLDPSASDAAFYVYAETVVDNKTIEHYLSGSPGAQLPSDIVIPSLDAVPVQVDTERLVARWTLSEEADLMAFRFSSPMIVTVYSDVTREVNFSWIRNLSPTQRQALDLDTADNDTVTLSGQSSIVVLGEEQGNVLFEQQSNLIYTQTLLD